jgi:hypothetical protein
VVSTGTAPIAQAVPLVRRALKILADREVTPQTGLLKSTLLQLDSTFSERNYGASSFLDFVEKLAQAGLVTLKQTGRSVIVELNDAFDEGTTVAPSAGADAHVVAAAPSGRPDEGRAELHPVQPPSPPEQGAHEVQPAGSAAEGVLRAGRILAAATGARWPMYLRNVKQILRQAEGGFDERRYGFGGLMDLLKACQKEGYIRIERDRRGGLRVFQGPALQRAVLPVEPIEVVDAVDVVDGEPVETQPGEVVLTSEAIETEQRETEPIPIDTTAELLGRAKPKRTAAGRGRSRHERPAAVAAPRKTAAKKPAARRSTRAKKQSATDQTEN